MIFLPIEYAVRLSPFLFGLWAILAGPPPPIRGTEAQAVQWVSHRDTTRNIRFEYPSDVGPPTTLRLDAGSPGRPVAYYFSSQRLGKASPDDLSGELAITEGLVWLSHTSMGLLYDYGWLAPTSTPESRALPEILEPLSAENFCERLSTPSRIDSLKAIHYGLPDSAVKRLIKLDAVAFEHSTVHLCERRDSVVTFHRSVPNVHMFGVIRFSATRYSSVQYIQRSLVTPPDKRVMDRIERLVRSVSLGS